MRVIFLAIVAFALGYLARPILSPYVEALINEYIFNGPVDPEPDPDPDPDPEERETYTFSFAGYLTDRNFNVTPGDGPGQIFDSCDPVSVSMTLRGASGEQLVFTDGVGSYLTFDDAAFDFEISVGAADPARTIVSNGSNNLQDPTSRYRPEGIDMSLLGGTVSQRAIAGDAFGYPELMSLSISSETATLDGDESYEEFAVFLNTATAASGNFEFRHCDESLHGLCPPITDYALPASTRLYFTETCSMG